MQDTTNASANTGSEKPSSKPSAIVSPTICVRVFTLSSRKSCACGAQHGGCGLPGLRTKAAWLDGIPPLVITCLQSHLPSLSLCASEGGRRRAGVCQPVTHTDASARAADVAFHNSRHDAPVRDDLAALGQRKS